MFTSTLLFALTALSGFASAQYNYSTSGNLTIDVNQLPSSLRQAWCRAETNSCPQICGGQASPNTCDSNSLSYTCTCTNGNSPNISDYDQTIPSFVCQQWRINCVANHPNDLPGQTGCLSVVCGSKNASSGETSSSSASSGSTSVTSAASSSATGGAGASSTGGASTTGSATQTGSASATSASAAATSSGAAVAMHLAQNYGTSIVGAGLLALFGLAL